MKERKKCQLFQRINIIQQKMDSEKLIKDNIK